MQDGCGRPTGAPPLEEGGGAGRCATREETLRLRRAALERFGPPAPRAPAPWSYRVGLLVATCATVAVPVFYALFVVAIGWSSVWYALHVPPRLSTAMHTSGLVWFVASAGPPLLGLFLCGFLLKPFLARRARPRVERVLDPAEQPFLFEYLQRLSASRGAPMPRSVAVDMHLNAGAGFETGFRNVFDGRMRLQLGLPLVSSLRLDELTAVLVHEFGHLSQGAGRRAYYLMASVNAWLARVIFERDAWDEALARASKSQISWVALWGLLARGGVWLSRLLLSILMRLGAAAAGALSRQMEFDADRSAADLCGSEAFARTLERLPVADLGRELAQAANAHAWNEGRLADDFPRLVRRRLERIEPEVREKVRAALETQTVEMYASHPPLAQRAERVRALRATDLLAVDAPATILFEGYGELCRAMTAETYRAELGPAAKRVQLVSADAVDARVDAGATAHARADGYFGGAVFGPTTLGLEPRAPRAPPDPAAALERLRALRAEVPALGAAAEEVTEDVARAEETLALAQAEMELRARDLGALDRSHAAKGRDAWSRVEQAERRAATERERFTPLVAALRERIQLALDLLCEDPAATDLVARGQRAVEIYGALRPASDAVYALVRRLRVLSLLGPHLAGKERESVAQLFRSQARRLGAEIAEVRASAGSLAYPFEHARADLTVADYLVGYAVVERDVEHVMARAAETVQAWQVLAEAARAEIAEVGLEAERALGLADEGPAAIEGGPRSGEPDGA